MSPTTLGLMIVLTLAGLWLSSDPPLPPTATVNEALPTSLPDSLRVVGYCGVASSLLWAVALVSSAWLRSRRNRRLP